MANSFFVIILAALLLDFALDVVANTFNLRALSLEPPGSLRDVYKAEEYRRSQEYTRALTRFGLLGGAFRLALLLAFWFLGGFAYLDSVVRAWVFPPVATGLAYTGILAFAYSLVNLPFSIYATFGIEARFGFNRTTPRTFVSDRIRGLALSTVLGAPLLAAVLALFGYAGAYAWLYVWAAVTVFGLVMQFIVPTWIMPLFNKFTPLGAGELKDAILSYASSVGYPVDKVFVMDASRRSSKSNAFLTGFGRNRRIVLFDTLVQGHTVPEVVAVLAHEIGHHKKRHIQQGLLVSIAHAGLVLLLLSLVLPSPTLYQAFYLDKPSIYAGLLFFGLLYAPLELMLSMGMLALSRRNEYEADRFAARTTRRPQDMVSALKKLFANNLANLSPHPFYVFLNYSHPPLLQRVQAIESVQMGR